MIASGVVLLLAMQASSPGLSAADQKSAFQAAGFKQVGKEWHGCDDPGTASYAPGAIEQTADLNGDGRPEAIVTESSSYCFGASGTGFTVVSKQANGAWMRVYDTEGVATVLPAKVRGWSEIQVGGPGFCHPVVEWNGKTYDVARRQNEQGKPCSE